MSDAPPADNARSKPVARGRRRLFVGLAMCLGVYVAVCLMLMAMENSLIFFPTKYPGGYWQPAGLDFEDAWFEAADGTKLHGWYLPRPDARAAVLVAHGNGGNLTHRFDLLQTLANHLGATVLIFDYRGYGRSEGSPSEAGVLADARAARKYLAERAGVAERDIVLFGESLGGGVMVDLAARDGARGLILESTFSSLPDVAAYHYSWLPVRMLMRSRLDSAAKIGAYHGPLLQLHGTHDTIIPIELGQRLFAAANEPKRFVAIEGRDHNDARSPRFTAELDRFFSELPPIAIDANSKR